LFLLYSSLDLKGVGANFSSDLAEQKNHPSLPDQAEQFRNTIVFAKFQ
jgi:hypothetical protein